jgi:hypothetical protein
MQMAITEMYQMELPCRLQPLSEDTFGGDAQQRYFVRPVHY